MVWISSLRKRLSGEDSQAKGLLEQFWLWFEANQDELADFEMDQERVLDKLHSRLQMVDPELCFEFGPREMQSGCAVREFVVSAGGIRSSFPAVTALVAAAPKLKRWKITAFRPRRSPINGIYLRGHFLDPKAVTCSLLSDGERVGIRIYIPEYDENEIAFKEIGYLMLDEALGEFDVETKVGFIQFCAPAPPDDAKRHSLVELPKLFDEMVELLTGRAEPAN
jgi:hypothetical protein